MSSVTLMPRSRSDPFETRLDDLHASPPASFIAARDAFARDLAREGHHRAEEVRKLPRPTLPTWSINLLARAERDRVALLLAAAERVREAHRRVLGGSGREVLQEANQALSTSLEQATSSAMKHAAAAGHPLSTGMAGRVRTTLRALALGEAEGRERLLAGRVLAESSDTGLAALESLSPISSRPPARAPKRPSAARQHESRERQRALSVARRDAAAAEKDLAQASARAARLREDATSAQRRADEMLKRSREAQVELEQLAHRVEDARRLVATLEEEGKPGHV